LDFVLLIFYLDRRILSKIGEIQTKKNQQKIFLNKKKEKKTILIFFGRSLFYYKRFSHQIGHFQYFFFIFLIVLISPILNILGKQSKQKCCFSFTERI
jgi:hypothetical protein